jgi:formylglycine-generating enzyme required for sulfatase activity
MVVLTPGKFVMGSAEPLPRRDDAPDDELNFSPPHQVIIARKFAVSKYEVTFPEWDACVALGGCSRVNDDGGERSDHWGHDARPVRNVTWDDAQKYVTWLSKLTGKTYRLLTEAEWEYAARAGTTTSYYFGDDPSELSKHAWYAGSGAETHWVGKKKPNAFGLYDVYGNVSEWVEDAAYPGYERAAPDGSARTGGGIDRRVVRGGSFADGSWEDLYSLSSTYRLARDPSQFSPHIGFRVARTLSE